MAYKLKIYLEGCGQKYLDGWTKIKKYVFVRSALKSPFKGFFPSSLLESLLSMSALFDGTYVGLSSCNEFTSHLGSGQKVVSYAYFTPWNKNIKQNYM